MKILCFRKKDFKVISDALEIAEDVTANFYKFSTSEWKKRHKYDVETLIALKKHQISNKAFALICKDVIKDLKQIPNQTFGVYLICLQDHVILNTLLKDKNLSLLPFLVYILTHELVHIVRFCNYYVHFNAPKEVKEKEEKIVNLITFDILKSVMLPKLSYVLEWFGVGIMDGQKPPGGVWPS